MRDDVVTGAVNLEFANHLGMRALDDADDLRFGAPIAAKTGDASHDTIAMHRLFGFARRQEQIAAQTFDGRIGYDETEAVAMGDEAADGELAVEAGDDVMAAASFEDLAFLFQPFQGIFDLGLRRALGAQFADELFIGGPGVRKARDVFQQVCVSHGLLPSILERWN